MPISKRDGAVLSITLSKPSDATVQAFAAVTQHLDSTRPAVLLDNTTIANAHHVLCNPPTSLPHHILDLAVVATAVAFYDQILYLAPSSGHPWHEFFRSSMPDDDDGPVFRELLASSWKTTPEIWSYFHTVFEDTQAMFDSLPSIAAAYVESWRHILGVAPPVPRLLDGPVGGFLDTPKQPLDWTVDKRISDLSGFASNGTLHVYASQTGDDDAIEQFCALSTAKAILYGEIAEILGLAYLPSSLRGATRLAVPLASFDESERLLEEDLHLIGLVSKRAAEDISSLALRRTVVRLPIALATLLKRRIDNPHEDLIDCLRWLRQHCASYRKSVGTYLGQVHGGTVAGLERVAEAVALLSDGVPDTGMAGTYVQMTSGVAKVLAPKTIAPPLLDVLGKLLVIPAASKLYLRLRRPYLHTALSMKRTALLCADLSGADTKALGVSFKPGHLTFFQNLAGAHPLGTL